METVYQEIVSLKREVNQLYFENRKKDRRIEKLECVNKKLSKRITSLNKENKRLSAEVNKSKSILRNEIQNKKLSAEVNKSKCILRNEVQDKTNCDTFDVEYIISHKFTRNKKTFLIRWKNYDSTHDSWVEEKDLFCAEILQKYMKSIKS